MAKEMEAKREDPQATPTAANFWSREHRRAMTVELQVAEHRRSGQEPAREGLPTESQKGLLLLLEGEEVVKRGFEKLTKKVVNQEFMNRFAQSAIYLLRNRACERL